MILNEKSPLTVKVKSQKAELFFLQKTEATEISNRYSNIWKRIVNRSLHNMKQIKNLIRKKILFFVENNNIQIDPELKKQYLIDEIKSLNIKNKNKSSKYIETILEEDENTIRNKNQSDISENNKSQKEKKKLKKVCFEKKLSGKNEGILKDKSLISEKSQEGEKQTLKGSKKKSGFKNEEINHKLKEENKHQKEIKYLNLNKFIEREKENINNYFDNEKINDEILYNNEFIIDIKETEIKMNNYDNNSNFFYSKANTKVEDNKNNEIFTTHHNHSSNINKLFKRRKKEKRNRNHNHTKKPYDKISTKSLSNDKLRLNINNKENTKSYTKNYSFSNLDTNRSSSFTINSIYDNINQISKYKYHQDSDLREKTKMFILKEINKEHKISNTHIYKKKNNSVLDIKANMILFNKTIIKKKSEHLPTTIIFNNIGYNTPRKPSKVKFNFSTEIEHKKKFSKSSKRINEYYNIQKDGTNKEYKKVYSMVNSNKKNISIKKKPIRKYESTGGKNVTFFNKIKRLKTLIKDKDNIEEENDKENKVIKLNYNKLISKNIEKNRQNLNNPEEYFEGFFNDIILKKQGNSLLDENNIKKRSSLGY